jgi:type 1 glutamine amidotransferase
MADAVKKRIDAVLIAGGKFHDIDFARLEILKLLAEDERVRVRVFENYDNIAAIEAADFLITYTCDVMPSVDAQEALKRYVESGKRWYALHGTNSILRFLSPEGAGMGQLQVDAPRWAPLFMQTLGSQFIAHPPIAPFRVEVTQPNHPLVKGIEPFETDDELYLMETHGELDTMLHCEFAGEATGFVEKDWPKAQHPVFYSRKLGKGAVLYLTLGHCRGHYDMKGIADFYPVVERCAWKLPAFYDLLRRGIAWVKEPALA